MASAPERFLHFLRSRRLKMTPERAAIVQAFLDAEGHLRAEELHARLRAKNSAVGLATVYRTLKLLVESGVATAFDAGEGVVLYEQHDDHAHHDHMVCERCGVKVEIVDPIIEERQKLLAEDQGFTLTRHLMLLYGLCAECNKKGE